MIDTRFKFDTSISNILNYSSYDEEGVYKFEITPLDVSGYSEQVTVKVFKHRVIFIPGIMGSELYSGSTKLWIPDRGNPLTRISKLEMDNEGCPRIRVYVQEHLKKSFIKQYMII